MSLPVKSAVAHIHEAIDRLNDRIEALTKEREFWLAKKEEAELMVENTKWLLEQAEQARDIIATLNVAGS